MAKENNVEREQKRPATRLPKILESKKVQSYIIEYYEKEGKESYPYIAISRWKKGTHYPPLDLLKGIAKIKNTNITYLLGLCDENIPCDYDKEPSERSLQDLLDKSGLTKRELALALNNNYRRIENFSKPKVYSLILLSSALGLSADYILGYTNWENWKLCSRISRSFDDIKAGTGIYIVADKKVQSKEDIERAIERGDGQYCLLSKDGQTVIFPDGKKYSVDDEMFLGAFVARVIPEVETN